MDMILALFIILALSAAIFTVPKSYKIPMAATLTAAAAVAAIALAMPVLVGGAEIRVDIWGTTAVVDSLTAVFLVVISLVSVSASIYAIGYLKPYLDRRSESQISVHGASMVVLAVAMMFVTMFRAAFPFLFFWELMTLASYLLVMFDSDRKEVAHAAMNYLVLMHVGFLFLFAGFVAMGPEGLDGALSVPVFLLFLVGFGMKAGIFPLHVWLPEAHPAAPSHVSALMSAVMIKMGVYGLFRLTMGVSQGVDTTFTIGMILFCVGIVTGIFGIRKAAVETNLKRLLAFSSIENVGIIFIGMGLGVIGRATGNDVLSICGFGGALLHTVNHAFFKSLLFMGAGSVYSVTHILNLDKLGGLARKMPVSSIVFLVGVMGICALPPFNGFFSEFILYFGMFDSMASSQSIIISLCGVVALAVIGGFAIITFSKAFGVAFLGVPRCCSASRVREVSLPMLLGQVIPMAGVLVGGVVFYFVIFDSMGLRLDGLTAVIVNVAVVSGVLVGVVAVVALLRWALMRGRSVRRGPTWGCGFTRLSPRTQYTATSYADELNHISSMGEAKGMFGEDEIFPAPHQFKADEHQIDIADKYITRRTFSLLRRMTARLALFQTGKTNDYVLHALLFIVFIVLLTITGIM